MARIEYRVELAPYDEHHDVRRDEFLAKLNELGKDGWRLVEMNPLKRPMGGYLPNGPVPMLLMREIAA